MPLRSDPDDDDELEESDDELELELEEEEFDELLVALELEFILLIISFMADISISSALVSVLVSRVTAAADAIIASDW
jgi:hypothetical protein